MRACVDQLNDQRFQGRPLRIKKAVEPRRLEKKKRRTAEKVELKKEMREHRKNEDIELDRLKNFERSAYGGNEETSTPAATEAATTPVPGIH